MERTNKHIQSYNKKNPQQIVLSLFFYYLLYILLKTKLSKELLLC